MLGYEQSAVVRAVPRLDWNVSAMRWGSATSTDKAYAYAYDRVDQLQSADYKLLSGGVWSPSASYQEGGLTYDLNGNILSVQRTGSNGENLHELTYTYDGYRLLSVGVNGTASDDYRYDADGNMIFDGRRGLTITYNTLNLPEEIVAGNQKISYIYSASGEKLACDANGSLTYYRSVMVYGSDNKLLYMLTPEGTVSRSEGSAGTSYTYNYFKTDHLGSTRVMLSAVDGTLQASQMTDFYPFGLAFEYSNLNRNRYLFSGKELQDGNLGGSMLEWYDFGARFYDPVLGRWFNVDPAIQFANPYLFCGNAPMMYIDQDGRFAWLALLAAVGIGAGVSAATYTISVALSPGGFQNWNWGQFFQNIGIGGLSGAVSFGVGSLVKESLGIATTLTQAMSNGSAIGAASGAAGGFFSGSVNSWINGAGLFEGLAYGIVGGGLGAAIGSVTGQMTGKAQFKKAYSEFMRLSAGDSGGADGPLVPSDQTLQDFSDTYFRNVKYRNRARLKYDNAFFENHSEPSVRSALAHTDQTLIDNKYTVRFATSAFKNKLELFITMGHEYVHVSQLAIGAPLNGAFYEYGAYSWQKRVLTPNLMHTSQYQQANRYVNTLGRIVSRHIRAVPSYINKGWGLPASVPISIYK